MLLGHSSGELQHPIPLYAFSFAIGILFLSLRVECCHLFGHFTMQTLFWVYRRCKVYCLSLPSIKQTIRDGLNGKCLMDFLVFFVFLLLNIKWKIQKLFGCIIIQLYFYGSWQYIRQISCFYIECEISNEF